MAYFDTLMTNQWGDHYMPMGRYMMGYDYMSDEGRQRVAALIFERMHDELGYFTATAGTAEAAEGETTEEAGEATEESTSEEASAEDTPAEEAPAA